MVSSQPGRGRVKTAKALVSGCHGSFTIQGLASPLPVDLLKRWFLRAFTLTSEPVLGLAKTKGGAGIRKSKQVYGKNCALLLVVKLNHRKKSGGREDQIRKSEKLKQATTTKNNTSLELRVAAK